MTASPSTRPAGAGRVGLFLFLVTATFGFIQPFVPLYMSAAGLSRSEIGLAIGIGTGLAVVFQPILGKLSDLVDRRRPFMAVSALCSWAAYATFPHVRGFWPLMLLFAVGTNGTTYLQAAGGALTGRMVAASKAGALYARLRAWGSVGYIAVSLISGLVLLHGGSKTMDRASLGPLFTYGSALFLVVFVLAWWLPDRRNRDVTVDEKASAGVVSPNLRRFLYAYFFYNMALFGATQLLSLFLKQLGATGMWVTGAFAAGVVIEVMVMRQAGAFSDRFGRRPALAFSFVLLPIRMLLYAPATGPWWVLAVQSLHGLNFGIVGAVAVAFANDLAREGSQGRAQARLFAVSGLASALGPVILGSASEVVGLRGMFVVAALMAAIGAVIMVYGVDDSHHDSASLSDRLPEGIRPFFRWLDQTPTRKVIKL